MLSWYTILQTLNEINASLQKLLRGTNIFKLHFNPTTKTKSKKGHNLIKILRMILVIFFCKLLIKSIHPCKSYWSETNINTPTKTYSKKGITQPKSGGWLPKSNLNSFYIDKKFCKVWMKAMHPFKSYRAEKNNKNLAVKDHNSAKLWRMMTNIELDLHFIVIWSSAKFEWNQYITFKSYWRETKSVTTTPTTPTTRTDNMIPMCLPCYAGDTINIHSV